MATEVFLKLGTIGLSEAALTSICGSDSFSDISLIALELPVPPSSSILTQTGLASHSHRNN